MHLFIDGYNLLHLGHTLKPFSPEDLQRARDQLVRQLSTYQRLRPCDLTVVFDGWRGGWVSEKRERVKGIELIFSKLGEKADDVIKRLIREKGAGAVVITSDRDIIHHAVRLSIPVISSEQFLEKMAYGALHIEKGCEWDSGEEAGGKKKGPSRRLSKKERRAQAALKKV
jgi:hypothetical protein